jgi:hypothetical protein
VPQAIPGSSTILVGGGGLLMGHHVMNSFLLHRLPKAPTHPRVLGRGPFFLRRRRRDQRPKRWRPAETKSSGLGQVMVTRRQSKRGASLLRPPHTHTQPDPMTDRVPRAQPRPPGPGLS